jgi:nicotinamidase-related amidase
MLIVLDMRNDFVDGVLANLAAKPILDPIARLVEHARSRDDWIVVYANPHQPGDLYFRVSADSRLRGSRGLAACDQVGFVVREPFTGGGQ